MTFLDSSKGQMAKRCRNATITNTWLNVKFVGTDISTSKVKWESSNPQKITIDKHGAYFFHEYPSGKGSVTFTTKLGNETFSFVVEYDMCELPYDESMF